MSGVKKFNDFFFKIYGDRWDSILSSLENDEVKVRRLCFPQLHRIDELPFDLKKTNWGEFLFEFTPGMEQVRDQSNLNYFYVMDPASVIVARQLNLRGKRHILDMCSAPGGRGLFSLRKWIARQNLFLTNFLVIGEIASPMWSAIMCRMNDAIKFL